MKVFTNTNFATGKAGADIEENVFVGLSTETGDVIQANADTVVIGVSHNYAADKGCPVTVIPLGAGFARVKAGEAMKLTDLGKVVEPDAKGNAVLADAEGATNPGGILAGLSADVEGATAAAKGDYVVVLLSLQGGKGDTGEPGAKGDPGDTPVKGTDYWTETDKAEIVADVLEALSDDGESGA